MGLPSCDWGWYPLTRSKTVCLIRHAQGHHNVAGEADMEAYKSWDFVDAALTDLGWAQTASLRRHLATRLPPPSVDLVVVSPLTRTLQTACAVFGAPVNELQQDKANPPLLMLGSEGVPALTSEGAPPFVATELCREHYGVHPCDKRGRVSHYKQAFPAVNFSQVESEEDVLWSPDVRESDDDLLQRAHRFVDWLLLRPEQCIAVVTHSGFLHSLLSQAGEDCSPALQTQLRKGFQNCELRVLMLADKRGDAVVPVPSGWNFPGGQPPGPSTSSESLDAFEGKTGSN